VPTCEKSFSEIRAKLWDDIKLSEWVRGFFRSHLTSNIHSDLHQMAKITVLYYSAAMTATKLTTETFALPDDGLKLSDLATLIASRHPNTGIDRVLVGTRWSVNGEMIYDRDSFVLKGGEEVTVIPRLTGG